MIEDEASAQAWVESLAECNAAARTQLAHLVELLIAENRRQNLVASSSLDHVWQRHIADSAQLILHVPRETDGGWLDLGTGAGFPGLVIAILCPRTRVIMVESRSKRALWLKNAATTLGLANSQVIASSLETVKTCEMSVISARAFAPLDRLVKLSVRFSTAETTWLLPKGQSAAHELQTLTEWQHTFHVEQSLTDRDAGIIVGRLSGTAGHSR